MLDSQIGYNTLLGQAVLTQSHETRFMYTSGDDCGEVSL